MTSLFNRLFCFWTFCEMNILWKCRYTHIFTFYTFILFTYFSVFPFQYINKSAFELNEEQNSIVNLIF